MTPTESDRHRNQVRRDSTCCSSLEQVMLVCKKAEKQAHSPCFECEVDEKQTHFELIFSCISWYLSES